MAASSPLRRSIPRQKLEGRWFGWAERTFLRRALDGRAVLGDHQVCHRAGDGRVGDLTRLDRHLETAELDDALAAGQQVARPITAQAAARPYEQAAAVGRD